MNIFTALLVILPIILLGWSSRKLNLLNQEQLKGLSSFVYYFGLPALFLSTLAQLDLFKVDYNIIIGGILPILIALIWLFLLKSLRIISKTWFILLSLSIVFGSNAFFGVAFFEAFYGTDGLNFIIISSAVLGPLGIILSILLFEYATQKGKGYGFIAKIFKNPLILAILIGVSLSLFKIKINFLYSALELLGQTAAPIAIFTLGMFIYEHFKIKNLKFAITPSLFRLILLPVFTALSLVFLIDSSAQITEFLFLQSGIPAAVSLFIFAERYQYQTNTISSMVIITSLGSFLILPLIYFLFIQ